MGVWSGPFLIAAVLLAAAGVAKAIDPTMTVGALRRFGLPVSSTAVRGLGAIDAVRRGPNDGHARLLQRARQVQRRLAAELHDHAVECAILFFDVKDFEHIHYGMAKANISMLENLGGELAEVAGMRVDIGAFPWRWVNGEGCICRVVAFLEG